jgi:hypothetical protein
MADDDDLASATWAGAPPSGKRQPSARRKSVGKALQSAGKSLNEASTRALMDQAASLASAPIAQPAAPRYMDVPAFKRGGKMRKSGVARLHKGERIERSRKGRGRSR